VDHICLPSLSLSLSFLLQLVLTPRQDLFCFPVLHFFSSYINCYMGVFHGISHMYILYFNRLTSSFTGMWSSYLCFPYCWDHKPHHIQPLVEIRFHKLFVWADFELESSDLCFLSS
jgi:hypothetical protein